MIPSLISHLPFSTIELLTHGFSDVLTFSPSYFRTFASSFTSLTFSPSRLPIALVMSTNPHRLRLPSSTAFLLITSCCAGWFFLSIDFCCARRLPLSLLSWPSTEMWQKVELILTQCLDRMMTTLRNQFCHLTTEQNFCVMLEENDDNSDRPPLDHGADSTHKLHIHLSRGPTRPRS